MIFNDAERDALGELVNIGFGRAASALSMLVGQRVVLTAPEVGVYPLMELRKALNALAHRDIMTVHQVFGGKLAGDAMLLMDTDSAGTLVDLLAGGTGKPGSELSPSDREALSETANILLNAFIGSFGNLLQVHISFTVPHLRVESVENMLGSLQVENRKVQYAVVLRVRFHLVHGDVSGYVVIVMGIESLDALFDAMRAVGFITE